MSAIDRLRGAFARRSHPWLVGLVVVGATIGVFGSVLLLAGDGPGTGLSTLGYRLAIVGYFAFLLGASGYVAFAAFERGFD